MSKNWSLTFRYWVMTLLAVVTAVFLWYVHEMIAPLIIAALVAYVLNPLVELFHVRVHMSRPLAIVVVFLIGLAVITGVGLLIFPTLNTEVQVLANDLVDIIAQAEDFLSKPLYFMQWEFRLGNLIPDPFGVFAERVTALPENLLSILESTTSNLIWLLVIIVATYYLLRDWPRLREWLISIVPEGYQSDAERLFNEIKDVWRGYLRGNLALMAIVGVSFTLAWLAVGLPGALILGIVAGILTIIPDLGPAIAAGLAAIVALFEGSNFLNMSNFWFAVLVVGIYTVLVNIKAIWIRPRIFGYSVHMHDGLVFVAIMVAVVVQGILAALVVVPVLASAGLLGHYIYAKLQGLPPWPEVPEQTNDEEIQAAELSPAALNQPETEKPPQ